ncbi:hypothetical protein ACKU2E_014225 [Klebsiella pneumoniae]
MTNNQLAENSVNQLLNSVKLARFNAELADNRIDHSFYYALTIALEELQERRKADSEPVAWTDEQELRDVDRGGCGYLFTVNPVTPHADERRIILLYRHAQPATASEPLAVTDDELNAALQLHRLKVDGHSQLSDAFRAGFRYARRTTPQPAPVVPEEMPSNLRGLIEAHTDRLFDDDDAQEIWSACRAAMLSGGKS